MLYEGIDFLIEQEFFIFEITSVCIFHIIILAKKPVLYVQYLGTRQNTKDLFSFIYDTTTTTTKKAYIILRYTSIH